MSVLLKEIFLFYQEKSQIFQEEKHIDLDNSIRQHKTYTTVHPIKNTDPICSTTDIDSKPVSDRIQKAGYCIVL